ncbi:multicopper oxidase family protein [Effusibacillus dendaii]|uniref:Copper oxidase n=1 Tax=Effusibacillus dendaii TaxID=2743772 RepID=A0A7I8DE16_9BACL|nr:copper oxidase [Effusibacillus dendaii]BCJ88354.1 hypothetical protein skT53_33390 [Effusibacillus dendaii]
MIVAPNLSFLPFQTYYGIKRFHLIAEEIHQTLTKGVTIRAWGYNGSTPGPVILINEGDRVQIALENRLPEATSIHWHGLVVPESVDGVPDIGAGPVVKSGETYVYDFVVNQAGTYMYHSHAIDAKQEMMGLVGMLVSLPRNRKLSDREYLILLQEWSVKTGKQMADMQMGGMQMGDTQMRQMDMKPAVSEPASGIFDIDPTSMDFNYFTMNGKAYPATAPLPVKYGETVRIRLANLSMDSHPMHLHGHVFQVVESDGMPLSIPYYKNTINVAPGETYDIEFKANNPGTWAFHCHKPHHMTNEHQSDMGGMFTIVRYTR